MLRASKRTVIALSAAGFMAVLAMAPVGAQEDAELQELFEAQEAYGADTALAAPLPAGRYTTAEAFVAGADWEFDGFVAGGQDSRIKSMFALNDLIYLNIGAVQGLRPGHRVSIYRRGDKVHDPQTGRFLGFEVRRAAIGEVTNKVDTETSAVRIIQTYEGVEVGDLVRLME